MVVFKVALIRMGFLLFRLSSRGKELLLIAVKAIVCTSLVLPKSKCKASVCFAAFHPLIYVNIFLFYTSCILGTLNIDNEPCTVQCNKSINSAVLLCNNANLNFVMLKNFWYWPIFEKFIQEITTFNILNINAWSEIGKTESNISSIYLLVYDFCSNVADVRHSIFYPWRG